MCLKLFKVLMVFALMICGESGAKAAEATLNFSNEKIPDNGKDTTFTLKNVAITAPTSGFFDSNSKIDWELFSDAAPSIGLLKGSSLSISVDTSDRRKGTFNLEFSKKVNDEDKKVIDFLFVDSIR